jgi:hypothetical protein
MELRCGACGKTGSYPVGRLVLDPDQAKGNDPRSIETPFAFTGYFHCRHCGAGEPWELTTSSAALIVMLMLEALQSPRQARIHLGKLTLFDGTCTRWPAQGERHLKQLIEKDPGDYFLHSRLGNLYKIGDAPDLALEAFRKAIERNPHDVESRHSIGELLLERGEKERAAEAFHQVLLHAHHVSARTSQDLLRNMVRHTLETLLELHQESGEKIPFLPTIDPKDVKPDPGKPAVVHLYNFDLADEQDWERMVDWWVTGKPPAHPDTPIRRAPTPRPSHPRLPGHVGRNDPCPCGSGKKFKNCCCKG